MADESKEGGRIRSNNTLFAIIDALQELEEATTTELANYVGVSKSTVHRHLRSLEDHEYIVRDDDQISLSFRFLDLGGRVRQQNEAIRQIRPYIEQLAEETGELSALVVEEHGMGVFVYRGFGNKAVGTDARTGIHMHLHAISAGKAILAHLSEEKVREIIDRRGLPEKTANTISDYGDLSAELERVRDRGYAFDRREHLEQIQGVAAPVRGDDGTAFGALSVVGPEHRMSGDWLEEEIPNILLGKINEFELDFKYS